MKNKNKITTFIIASLALSAPFVYASSGNEFEKESSHSMNFNMNGNLNIEGKLVELEQAIEIQIANAYTLIMYFLHIINFQFKN